MTLELLEDGSSDAAARLIFAHGAGAPMRSSYMQRIAEGLASVPAAPPRNRSTSAIAAFVLNR